LIPKFDKFGTPKLLCLCVRGGGSIRKRESGKVTYVTRTQNTQKRRRLLAL